MYDSGSDIEHHTMISVCVVVELPRIVHLVVGSDLIMIKRPYSWLLDITIILIIPTVGSSWMIVIMIKTRSRIKGSFRNLGV